MDFKTASELAQIAASLFTGVGLVYPGWQVKLIKGTHRDNHEWNRRLAAQEALEGMRSLVPIHVELNELFDASNSIEPIPLQKILDAFENNKSIQIKVHQLLNAYESLARGVYQSIYDEEVIKAARRGEMIRQFDIYSNYIKHRRKSVHKRAMAQMESMVNKWRAEENSSEYREQTGG